MGYEKYESGYLDDMGEKNLKESMPYFDIKLNSIKFGNDACYLEEIEDVLSMGTAECEFVIKNISDVDAYNVTFEKFDSKIYGHGIDIDSNSSKNITKFIKLHKVNHGNLEYTSSLRRNYSLDKKIYMSNGIQNFSFIITFEFWIQKNDTKKPAIWELCKINDDDIKCKTSRYSLEETE